MFDEKTLTRALQDATKPLADGLKDLGNKFDEHRMAMVESVAGIKKDIEYLREGQDDASDCEAKKNWPLVSQLLRKDEITSSIRVGKPSVSPSSSPSRRNGMMQRLAPFASLILAAALGLIGIGFYLASGDADDATATVRALRALTDTTTKMSGELAKIKTELDAGTVQ